jgi:hypothetical protein
VGCRYSQGDSFPRNYACCCLPPTESSKVVVANCDLIKLHCGALWRYLTIKKQRAVPSLYEGLLATGCMSDSVYCDCFQLHRGRRATVISSQTNDVKPECNTFMSDQAAPSSQIYNYCSAPGSIDGWHLIFVRPFTGLPSVATDSTRDMAGDVNQRRKDLHSYRRELSYL